MKGLSLLFLLLIGNLAKAQLPYKYNTVNYIQNVIGVPFWNDSAELTDPQKATYLAMVLPGAGQIYNKKIWKAGIVYAGIAGLVYFNRANVDSLKKYELIYTYKIDEDPNTIDNYPDLSTTSAKNFRDFHRRNRDISILGFVGLYAIQIIDANVDAHLKEFKVNEELSLRFTPSIYAYQPGIGSYSGVSLKLKF